MEILLKFVIQAIPAYCMNVFLLPVVICHDIQVIMNHYWLSGSKEGSKGIN